MNKYYSCFISYSHKDRYFADQLYRFLRTEGISCWKDNHEFVAGDSVYDRIAEAIRNWDKFVLCCSENSLTSWWVDNEIKILLEKEQQLTKDKGKRYWLLMPVDLDGRVWDWESGISTQLKVRYIVKAQDWENNPAVLKETCRLITRALRVDNRPAPPPSQL